MGAVGCGSSSDSSSGQISQVGTNFIVARVDLSSPTTVDVVRFAMQALDPAGVEQVVQQIEVAKAGGATQDIVLTGLSVGEVIVRIQGFNADGELVGVFEGPVQLVGGQALISVDSLALLGQTREVGRISVSSNGEQGNFVSSGPTISSDGNLVAFSSRSILSSQDTFLADSIYLRNRKAATTTLISPSNKESCINPRLSGDGSVIVFQTTENKSSVSLFRAGVLTTITPATASLGGGTADISAGRNAWVSEKGDAIVYEAAVSGSNFLQIALYRLSTNTTTILSKTAGNLLANGDCSDPVVSPDGASVFFSTQASNLTLNGLQGLLACNVATGALQAVAGSSAFPCSCSRDGKLVTVNVAGRLLLINRSDGTTTEIPFANANAIVGGPSMSYNGNKISFMSGLSNLVSNDENGVDDVFVFDRSENEFTRVNVAADGSTVQGTASQLAMAGGGSRIAYSSNDSRLVEGDTNGVGDIFSSVVPTPGLLYTTLGDGTVLRYKRAAFMSGNPAPDATITLSLPTPDKPRQLLLDSATDTLYLFEDGNTADAMHVITQISLRSGTVTPKSVSFPDNPFTANNLPQLDLVRNFLVGGSRLYSPLTALAPIPAVVTPKRTTLNAAGELLYTRDQTCYQSVGNDLRLVGLDSDIPPQSVGIGQVCGDVVLDPAPRYGAGLNNPNVIAAVGSAASTRVFTFSPTAFASGGASTRSIAGANCRLGRRIGNLHSDPFTGNLYVGTAGFESVGGNQLPVTRLQVFPANANGNVAASRSLIEIPGASVTSPELPPFFVVDRTR